MSFKKEEDTGCPFTHSELTNSTHRQHLHFCLGQILTYTAWIMVATCGFLLATIWWQGWWGWFWCAPPRGGAQCLSHASRGHNALFATNPFPASHHSTKSQPVFLYWGKLPIGWHASKQTTWNGGGLFLRCCVLLVRQRYTGFLNPENNNKLLLSHLHECEIMSSYERADTPGSTSWSEHQALKKLGSHHHYICAIHHG